MGALREVHVSTRQNKKYNVTALPEIQPENLQHDFLEARIAQSAFAERLPDFNHGLTFGSLISSIVGRP
jgi:hypothetical protein